MTRDEIDDIAEKFGWGSDEEREASLREMAERQQRIRSAENLTWAKERAAARAEAERQPVAKAEATMATDNTAIWESWIRAEIKKSARANDDVMIGAMSDLLGKERSARQTLEAETAVVRQELAALKLELAELRGELKTKSAMADMEARLMRLETPTRLKTVG